MEPISLKKYLKILTNKWKLILFSLVGFVLIAIVVILFFYKPTYISTSQVLIQQTTPSTYIIDLGQSNFVKTDPTKNPIITEVGILTSDTIAKKAWDKLKNDPDFEELSAYPENIIAKLLQKTLDIDTPPQSEIISVSNKWEDPIQAQKIAKAYIDAYYENNVQLNKRSITQMREFIEQQLKDSQNKLATLRTKIKDYKRSNNSVNIAQEAVSMITQIATLENNISTVNSQIGSEQGRIAFLSKRLGVSVDKAINSIALGQNGNFNSLKQQLTDLEQELSSLSVKYTDTNPKIVSLKQSINKVKAQLNKEISATIGRSATSKDIITDQVRTEIVSELVKSKSLLKALKEQRRSLNGALGNIKGKQKGVPEKQNAIEGMLTEEVTLTKIVETLNTKLMEAKLKESEIVSNLTIIDNPMIPLFPAFPTAWHLFFLFAFAGLFFGVTAVIGLYFVEDTCTNPEEFEEILKAPLIGTIPWLNFNSYNTRNNEYNPNSAISIIFQRIVTTIKVKCFKKNINVIGLLSSDFVKKRSVITAHIGRYLAKSGKSVLIIDADFREGCIATEFGLNQDDITTDITDLMVDSTHKNSLLYKISTNPELFQTQVSKYIKNVTDVPNLYILPNTGKIENPYEVLSGEGFSNLIASLKGMFDLIIVDTPPILAVADSIMISQALDGLIVLSGVKTPRSNLRKIRKICDDNFIELLGVISRETITELELPETQYIKQLSTDPEEVLVVDEELQEIEA